MTGVLAAWPTSDVQRCLTTEADPLDRRRGENVTQVVLDGIRIESDRSAGVCENGNHLGA